MAEDGAVLETVVPKYDFDRLWEAEKDRIRDALEGALTRYAGFSDVELDGLDVSIVVSGYMVMAGEETTERIDLSDYEIKGEVPAEGSDGNQN